MAMGKSTFCAFIDFQKVFDWVDRELLLYKMLSHNVNGVFYKSTKKWTVIPMLLFSINDVFTSKFTTNNGMNKEDNLSPVLFNVYIKYLITEIKELDLGVQVGDSELNILVYADDIVLMADSKT